MRHQNQNSLTAASVSGVVEAHQGALTNLPRSPLTSTQPPASVSMTASGQSFRGKSYVGLSILTNHKLRNNKYTGVAKSTCPLA